MLCPLQFKPIFKPRIWGGRRLERLFGKPMPQGEKIGESWELADLPEDKSIVLGGPHHGKRIDELVSRFGAELLGDVPTDAGQFPLLIKLLDAHDILSVQVHPDLQAAERMGPPVRPKYEAWYVIDAQPGSFIYRGFKQGVNETAVRDALADGTLEKLLLKIPVQAGQWYYLPGGAVHALGAGIVVAEVQTPSDTTFRLFDWNRIDPKTGQGRQLHVEQALQCINYRNESPLPPRGSSSTATDGVTSTTLVNAPFFTIEKVVFDRPVQRPISGGRMTAWIVISGSGRLDYGWNEPLQLQPGQVILLPAAMPPVTASVQSGTTLLQVVPRRP